MVDENWISLSRGLGAKVDIIHGEGIRIVAYRKIGNRWFVGNSTLITLEEVGGRLKK